MIKYPILKTDDIDIKLFINNTNINGRDIYFNVLIDLMIYLNQNDIYVEYNKIIMNKMVTGVYADSFDITIIEYDDINVVLQSYKRVYDLDFESIVNDIDEYGINNNLNLYNILYMFIYTIESIQNEKYINRIPKCPKVFARFILLYIVYSDNYENIDDIMNYLKIIQDYIDKYGNKNYLKLEYFIRNKIDIFKKLVSNYIPDQYYNNQLPLYYNMANSILNDNGNIINEIINHIII